MSQELVQQMIRELEELTARHPQVMIALTPRDAFSLIGVLQLALRYPGFAGSTRELALHVKETLIATVATSPALAAVARMGDDPAFDS